MKKNNYIKHFIILIPIIILMIISFFNMKNASLISTQYTNHLNRQIMWYILGYLVVIIFLFIKPTLLLKSSFYLYAINVLLLLLVLIFGKTINGARAWFDFGFFSYQPSETMKLTLLLYLLKINTTIPKNNIFLNELKLILKVLFITLIPTVLTFLEPDTGAILIYGIIALVTLLFSNIRKRWFSFFFLTIIIILGIFFAIFFFKQDTFVNLFGTSFFYRIDRLIDFKNGSGMQLENSLIAIGVSKTFGNGFNNFTIYIPEAPTDFIFALTITNFGFVGGLLVVLLSLTIDVMLLLIIINNSETKIKKVASTIFTILLFQQVQNILMNIGLAPIIGIPLPFLSYGGTNLIVLFCFIGLLISMLISKEKYPLRVF